MSHPGPNLPPSRYNADWVRVDRVGRVTVISMHLPEELDSSEFDTLNEAVLQTLATGTGTWVLDLSAVNYMGSSILGLLVNLRTRVKSARGTLVLAGLSPFLLNIFRTCSLERLFTITKTRADALASLGG